MAEKRKFPIYYNAPAVLTFALISLIVLLVSFATGGFSDQLLFCVYRSRFSFTWVIRLFGHVFGHAGWEHYLNNMTTMLLIGPMLEEKYGSKAMIEFMAITAVITGAVHLLFFQGGLYGASGIVFMMIVLASITGVKNRQIPLTLILVVIVYLGDQIISGLFSTDNISQLTHIVGGILGGFFGLFENGMFQKK